MNSGVSACLARLLFTWFFAWSVTISGCGRERSGGSLEANATISIPEVGAESLEFAGRIWRLAGPASQHGDVSRAAMNAREFISDSADERVIEFKGANPNTTLREGTFSRILQRQVKRDSEWISDGPRESWLLNGTRETCTFVQGQKQGTLTVYRKDGTVEVVAEYENDAEISRQIR